jgi:general secretion pathway protein G
MKHARPVITVLIVCIAVGVLVAFILPSIIGEQETAKKNACINNLRLIDGAKHTWAPEYHKSEGEVPTWADFNPYLMRGSKFDASPALTCPDGGAYVIGAVTSRPTCSIAGHVLP